MDRNRILELAIEALQKQKAGIDEEMESIKAELKGTGVPIRQTTPPVTRRGRTRTAAERKVQAQRMREYWAKRKAKAARPVAAVKTAPAVKSTKTRSMTAAHKKALSLKMKQVWKKRKAAAGKKTKAN